MDAGKETVPKDIDFCIEITKEDNMVYCSKGFNTVEHNDTITIYLVQQSVMGEGKLIIKEREIAQLPRQWFYVYDSKTKESFYMTFVNNNEFVYHEDLDFLLRYLKRHYGNFYYVSYYKLDIYAYINEKIAQEISMDEFKKRYCIDLRKCINKPWCFFDTEEIKAKCTKGGGDGEQGE